MKLFPFHDTNLFRDVLMQPEGTYTKDLKITCYSGSVWWTKSSSKGLKFGVFVTSFLITFLLQCRYISVIISMMLRWFWIVFCIVGRVTMHQVEISPSRFCLHKKLGVHYDRIYTGLLDEMKFIALLRSEASKRSLIHSTDSTLHLCECI